MSKDSPPFTCPNPRCSRHGRPVAYEQTRRDGHGVWCVCGAHVHTRTSACATEACEQCAVWIRDAADNAAAVEVGGELAAVVLQVTNPKGER